MTPCRRVRHHRLLRAVTRAVSARRSSTRKRDRPRPTLGEGSSGDHIRPIYRHRAQTAVGMLECDDADKRLDTLG
jgi:hypothetical protein